MRELLDPTNEHGVALPPDDDLIGDLTTPKWKVTSAGKIEVESKDATKGWGRGYRARLGRSSDKGDATIMAFYPEDVRVLWALV